jgi:hypothetical protein
LVAIIVVWNEICSAISSQPLSIDKKSTIFALNEL